MKVKLLSRARLLATPWTAAYQVPLSMGFSRQEYWSGVPLPFPINLKVKHTEMLVWGVAALQVVRQVPFASNQDVSSA